MRIATVGTRLRYRHGEATIMARQQVEALMVSERHIAILAFWSPAAGVARQYWGKSATVLEQYDLLAIGQRVAHRRKETWRERARHHLAMTQVLNVHDLYLWQFHALETRGEGYEAVFARNGIVVALHGRRGSSKQGLGTKHLRHDDRRRTGMVTRRRVLLLETRLVLLVDNDEAEFLKRQEDGTSCSKDNVVRIV